MTLDDIKGRTYTSTADFWRDIESVIARAESRIRELECIRTLFHLSEARVKELAAERDAAIEVGDRQRERAKLAERQAATLLSGLRWALANVDVNDLRARVHALVDEYEDES